MQKFSETSVLLIFVIILIFRYTKLTTIDPNEPKMYCKEKWDLDTALFNGIITHSELGGRSEAAISFGGRDPGNNFYDPAQEAEFIKLKREWKAKEKNLDKKNNYVDFTNKLAKVPHIPYRPEFLTSSIGNTISTSMFDSRNVGETCASIEHIASSHIKGEIVESIRGPYLDTKPPKSPWMIQRRIPEEPIELLKANRGPGQLLPSEKVASYYKHVLDTTGELPIEIKLKESPERNKSPNSASSKKKEARLVPINKKKEVSMKLEDEDISAVDTAPMLSEEMNSTAKKLLTNQNEDEKLFDKWTVSNITDIPPMPVTYCGPSWNAQYKKKPSRNVQEIDKMIPTVTDYINSLRDRVDFDYNNHFNENRKSHQIVSSVNSLPDEKISDGNSTTVGLSSC